LYTTTASERERAFGALGSATAGVVETLAPLIAAAPVTRRVREKWLERLFDAIQEDDPPYIESLAEHWGAAQTQNASLATWSHRRQAKRASGSRPPRR
jgi:hypothetical protein